jgi:hypothetical protein
MAGGRSRGEPAYVIDAPAYVVDTGQRHNGGRPFKTDPWGEPEAATTQNLQGPPGSELGTGGFPHGDKEDSYRLWNLAPLLNQGPDGESPAEPPYTRIFKGRGAMIDHILASHRLVNPRNKPEARTVLATEGLPSVTEDPGERGAVPASDHAAVVASFSL